MEKYDHRAIEEKWQQKWAAEGVFAAAKQGGTYVLDMFPYPSGDGLHVGHPEGYTATDIYSRYLRMNGQSVLHPMGWDAFGLPAENAAIKKGIHPAEVTAKNIANFKRQIQSLGFSYDWDREVNTTDPAYYKWTQWIFLQLFKHGLAYEKEAPIWWCPKDKTGLANEEVVNGCCERCGTPVEKKMLKQWMLKITAYADRLLDGLEKLDWPEGIKALQRNWIGKSEGAEVDFSIDDQKVTVFTTRPDTLFGATYLVLSPEHQLVDSITTKEQAKAVAKYKKDVAAKSDLERTSLEKEKTGVFTGAYAINPVNHEKIPVWIADYVLSSYGTGAIMAVPAHDERDFAFARKFELPIIEVVHTDEQHDACWTGEGVLMNSGNYDGQYSEAARMMIVQDLAQQQQAKEKTQYKLRDWVFSRQRYWGEPIPLVHCEYCRQQVESTPHYLNFYNQTIWDNLISGRKTIETRALNPEEPERYFGNIVAGHENDSFIKAVFKPTGATAYFRVKNVTKYASLAKLFADVEAMKAIAPTKTFTSLEELEAAYEKLAPGYVEKIKKNGLIAFEVKHIIPGVLPLHADELPLKLPQVEKYEPTGTGESPLAGITDWVNVKCRICGHPAKRETNTMPQWAGSCWYYLRFTDPHNSEAFASLQAMKNWLPVDMYVGGAEHAVLHLLYSRFWHKVLFDAGYIPKEVGDEPFMKLKNQGLILGPDGEKMSKSRGNVINPDEIVEKFGADTLRMYEMFMGPFEDAKPWDTNGIIGIYRFINRVWIWVNELNEKKYKKNIEVGNNEMTQGYINKTIKKVTEDIEKFRFNTAISQLMTFYKVDKFHDTTIGITYGFSKDETEAFLKLLSPFAPHIAEELWSQLGHDTLLVQESWPKFDPKKVIDETVTIAVQVMGKLRATISLAAGVSQSEVEQAAKAEQNVQKFLTSEPKKVIFVQDKLINFVV